MAKFNYNELKEELQGDKGMIRIIRERHLPDTTEMAHLAQKRYEIEINKFSDIDFSLNQLLIFEYELFLEKQKEITEKFIEYADCDATKKNFPIIRKVIDDYKNQIEKGVDPTKTLRGIVNIIVALADSNRQSRVSRSGSSLMHHISYLLEKKGFQFKINFEREFVLEKGCKLDFFFPNKEMYLKEPKNCCAVACQTTSNDRFRLTFAQMPHDTRNRACTAIGNPNFGKNLGPQSLTDNKLIEAREKGVKFVILATAIDQRLINSRAVMSYQEWFEELISIKSLWK